MSKVKSIVAAALTLAAVSTAAHAALFSVQFVPNQAPSGALASYTVQLVGTSGAQVTDYSNASFTLPTGNSFSQVAAFDDGDANGSVVQVPNSTYTLDYFQYAGQEGAYANNTASRLLNLTDALSDTHFDVTYGEAPASDDVTGEPATGIEATVLGVGFSFTEGPRSLKLNGGVTIGAANRAPVYNLANIVIPTAQVTPITYSVTDLSGNVVSGTFTPGASAPTPEPASLGVLALGGVALLTRRKSHASK